MRRGSWESVWNDAGHGGDQRAFDQGERDGLKGGAARSGAPASPDQDEGAGLESGAGRVAHSDRAPVYLGNNMFLHPAPGVDPHHVVGKPHADRARQFVPFMALKGYQDLVKEAEVVPEPRWALTDADRLELSEQVRNLQRGQLARVAFYVDDHYRYVCDRVRQVDETFGVLRLENAAVPFAQIDQVTTGA